MDNAQDNSSRKTNNATSIVCEVQTDQNVSFSFNLDLDMTNDSRSNSDAELEIDVSAIDDHELKRNREIDKDISVFNEMEEEIERQLDAKAARTNLTAKNVKNILKHVITNEHVMAMVKRRAYNVEDDVIFEPKLTRAKAKELAMSQPDIPWPITPVKKQKGSEVQVLIEEELAEDSSDEEYKPGQDEHSDDDREMETSAWSDVDSQPSTPSVGWTDTSMAVEEGHREVPDVDYDTEGVFKIPEIPLHSVECGNIGQRTRSKLSLSQTPLEQIEQAFVPPDITTDMYDWDVDTDEDWNNFLKEFTQPLAQEINGEDDPDADPEYNILEDEETDLLDKEELRMDKAVKVTRKELNNLVAELFEFADMFSRENQDATKKKKSSDSCNISSDSCSLNGTFIELLPALAEPELPKVMSPEQRSLLEVQLTQHVQLMTQHFAMTYMNPELHAQSTQCRSNLNSLRYMTTGENSAFNVLNLSSALKLVSDWEYKLSNESFKRRYVDYLSGQIAETRRLAGLRRKYIPKFHRELEKILMESKALMYPQLLPEIPFTAITTEVNVMYLESEKWLIAMGLDQFVPFIASESTKFPKVQQRLIDVTELISRYLMPSRKSTYLERYIRKLRHQSQKNPIQDWYKTGQVKVVKHCIIPLNENQLIAPKDQPRDMIPKRWQDFLNEKSCESRNRLFNICKDLSKRVQVNPNDSHGMVKNMNSPLLNPIVSMLPGMPSLSTPVKNTSSDNSDKTENPVNPDLQKSSTKHDSNECILSKSFENLDSPPSTRSDGSRPLNSRRSTSPKRTSQDAAQRKPAIESRPKSHQLENLETSYKSVELNPESELTLCMEFLKDEQTPTVKMHMPEINLATPLKGTHHRANDDERATTIDSDTSPRRIDDQDTSSEKVNFSDRESTMEPPQLRKTTPRLAKIRSAQNMKMMAQILGSKGTSPNSTGVKHRGRRGGSKSMEEPSTSSNGDNEDEIAELMLASTTIKKDTALRKKAKQARELENIKRLIEAENDLSQEERATKFAVSFLQKLHKALDPSNPEIFKAIVKLFLEYDERSEGRVQSDSESCFHAEQPSQDVIYTPIAIDTRVENGSSKEGSKDALTINLYNDVCEKLKDHPELKTDFLLFLKPHQAAMIGKSVEHTMLQKMNEFVEMAQIYFAKQPSRLSKLMQAITQLAAEPCVTLEKVNAVMSPLLKGHPLVMDAFSQVLPNGKPPESLFAPHMFENLTCPPGPHDKNKIYSHDASELYENIEMPVSTSHEDPYGGDNCKCECHNLDDHNLKTRSDHCVSCGTRFLNGRIYLQTSEGLRPAKVTFPGSHEEKQEHIARVSLKTTERSVPVPQTRRSRKSSKNSPDQGETKRNKSSPSKDIEEMDKSLTKSKRVGKVQLKSKERKKSPKPVDGSSKLEKNNANESKGDFVSPVKTKREERAEKREAQDFSRSKQSKVSPKHSAKSNKMLHLDIGDEELEETEKSELSPDESSMLVEIDFEIAQGETEMSTNETELESNISLEKMDVSSDSCSDTGCDQRMPVDKPWTRQEDAILLECIKKEYSENTFLMISETLGDRTVQQVKDRFHVLLELLERMA